MEKYGPTKEIEEIAICFLKMWEDDIKEHGGSETSAKESHPNRFDVARLSRITLSAISTIKEMEEFWENDTPVGAGSLLAEQASKAIRSF